MILYTYENNYIITLETSEEYFNEQINHYSKFKSDENDEFKIYELENYSVYKDKKIPTKIIEVKDIITGQIVSPEKYKLGQFHNCRKSYELIENDILEHLWSCDIVIEKSKPVIIYDANGIKRTEFYYNNGVEGFYTVYDEKGNILNKIEFVNNKFFKYVNL